MLLKLMCNIIHLVVAPPTPPIIVESPNDTSVDLSEPLNLTCDAMGNPPPSYQWYRDDVLIEGANLPYLYIPEATPEDRGSYTCVATNENGNTSSNPGLTTIPGIWGYIPVSIML